MPDMPGAMRVVVRLNPLSYGVDGLRGALSGGFAFGAATDLPSSASSPQSYLRSGVTCSQRSRGSRRPDDQFGHLT